MRSLTRIMSLGVVAAVLASILGACGSQDPAPGGGSGVVGTGGAPGGIPGTPDPGSGGISGTPGIPAAPYQPLMMNATWTYQVNDRGVVYEETNVVEALEDLGGGKAGTMAYRLRETMPNETQLTWYQVTDTLVMRHHEQALDATGAMKSESWFSPHRLRLDETAEHLVNGATWTASFTENHTSRSKPPSTTTKTETWHVMAAEEPITVPAGTFKALRVSRTDQSDGSIKTFWFARGVGKIKETTETGHTEELSRYTIPQ